jgi:transcriptional regulator with XRE-family HTH domain
MKKVSTNKECKQDLKNRYLVSVMLRDFKDKHNFSYADLSEVLGFKRQYIYGVEQVTVRPSEEFINKFKQLERVLNV